jgi:hypothetical protein
MARIKECGYYINTTNFHLKICSSKLHSDNQEVSQWSMIN